MHATTYASFLPVGTFSNHISMSPSHRKVAHRL
ncbi:Protein of unknown function [Pyronema omphalodes CBS 100304]|uniref:Uncharacterized protein n=1 Tax=Pyronema omphalodes (strain CBS 100304) TaxID=1076935 RepID=U4LIU5_PYROM|nr:Protein of unknown function [Pyronema omphalodes CBS 100304]